MPGSHPNRQSRGEKIRALLREQKWVVFLKNETTLFKNVTFHDLLNHLGTTSTGGESINMISLHQDILSWWVEDPQVLEFITGYEESKRKATRDGFSILDVWIFDVASHSLLAEKASLTSELILKGYRDLTRPGKSGNPTSKMHRRRSRVSSATPTPTQIPLALATKITFKSQWYATMRYWFPLRAFIGNLSVSSV